MNRLVVGPFCQRRYLNSCLAAFEVLTLTPLITCIYTLLSSYGILKDSVLQRE